MESPIRISDDDRERYTARLRSAYAEGRLDGAELEDRLTAVLDARFEADLVPLTADLPNPPGPLAPVPIPAPAAAPIVPPPAPAVVQRRPLVGSKLAAVGLTPFIMAPLICTAIFFMTDPGDDFWPKWVWFGCSIPVVSTLVARRLGE